MASAMLEKAVSAVQSGDFASAENLLNRVVEFSADSEEVTAAKDYLNKIAAGEITAPKRLAEKPVTLTTAPSLEGYRVVKTLGIVTAEAVMGMNIFRDFLAGVRSIVGGRSTTTQKSLREARDLCLRELKEEAFALGGNAVIASNLDYSEFSNGGNSMLFLVASGTAVVVVPINTPPNHAG